MKKKTQISIYIHPDYVERIDTMRASLKASRSEVVNIALKRYFEEDEDDIIRMLEQIVVQQNKDHHYLFLLIEMMGLMAYSQFKNEKSIENKSDAERGIHANKKMDKLADLLAQINNKEMEGILSKLYERVHERKKQKEMN